MYATNILTAILTPDDFSVVLSALNTLEGLTTISNPKLIVANEQTATIKMATDEPNIKISVQRGNAQLGQNDLYTSELDPSTPYFTYGITVDVTPRININGDISVKITPTLSHKIEKETKIVGSNAYPVIASRTLDTQFTLGNGRTAAIGGLTSVGDNDVRSKIPVLGDIPLIGKYLFSHTSKVREQKEIIIFVTCNTTDSQTERNAGVPDDSLLIYRQQEQDRKRRIELDTEMKARAEAAAAETNAPARKPKKATFKDSPMYDLPLDGI
jgi:type II secretory pathway component GspD/PulD (secretin)